MTYEVIAKPRVLTGPTPYKGNVVLTVRFLRFLNNAGWLGEIYAAEEMKEGGNRCLYSIFDAAEATKEEVMQALLEKVNSHLEWVVLAKVVLQKD